MHDTIKPLPRGIRNNNPGNIIQGNVRWLGERGRPFDPKFIEFTAPVFGLRALMKILQTYYNKYGLDTVQSIINRWAPPHENATDNYAFHVAKQLGVQRFYKIDINSQDIMVRIAKAIAMHENGKAEKPLPEAWYPDELYRRAFILAHEGG